MKARTFLVVIVAVLVLALLAWKFMPGVREKGRSAYRKYGGWTEEARRDDPIGFIEYADKKLNADLSAMRQTRRDLSMARENIKAELRKTEELLAAATELAESFRAAYTAASGGGGFPVKVSGREYTRDQLIEQVRLILMQRENYASLLVDLKKAEAGASAKQEELVPQIARTEALLATLPAKKEVARANKLTGRTEELLAKVDDVLVRNEEMVSASPVRTVEELAGAREIAGEGADEAEVMKFLEGKE
jgi:hypothetical protein